MEPKQNTTEPEHYTRIIRCNPDGTIYQHDEIKPGKPVVVYHISREVYDHLSENTDSTDFHLENMLERDIPSLIRNDPYISQRTEEIDGNQFIYLDLDEEPIESLDHRGTFIEHAYGSRRSLFHEPEKHKVVPPQPRVLLDSEEDLEEHVG